MILVFFLTAGGSRAQNCGQVPDKSFVAVIIIVTVVSVSDSLFLVHMSSKTDRGCVCYCCIWSFFKGMKLFYKLVLLYWSVKDAVKLVKLFQAVYKLES